MLRIKEKDARWETVKALKVVQRCRSSAKRTRKGKEKKEKDKKMLVNLQEWAWEKCAAKMKRFGWLAQV